MDQRSLFGLTEHLAALSKHGDPLEALDATVDFEYFRGWLVEGLGYGDGSKGGSAKHLQAYLNEFTFRFNRRFCPFNAFRSLLWMAGDTTAPTRAGLYSGEWQHPTCCGYAR